MSTYLFENPWPIFWLLLPALAVLIALFRSTGNRRFVLCAGLVLLALLIPFVLDALVRTPAEEVTDLLDRLVEAALAKDVDTLVRTLAPDYDFGGSNHAAIAAVIRGRLESIDLQSLSLNGRKIEENSPTSVTARFVAAATLRSAGGGATFSPRVRLQLQFEREAKGWEIVGIQRYDIIDATSEVPLRSQW